MAKLRRFSVQSLEHAQVGASFLLPPDESRHVHVLRLKPGSELEAVDASGRCVRAVIVDDTATGVSVRVLSVEASSEKGAETRLILGVAWPKGKRAAVLVEKCAELGVDEIVPVLFDRGVVSKDDESEGLVRLRRIAAEACKQSRRRDALAISAEMTLPDFLTRCLSAGPVLLMDPYADLHLVDFVVKMPKAMVSLALLIGPEGGMTAGEIEQSQTAGAVLVKMAEHVLRIETAAIAAAAVCKGILASKASQVLV